MKLHFTAKARKQLEKIYRYYEALNEKVAVEIYNEILDEAERLISFPRLAPEEPILSDFPQNYRSLIVRNLFKIVYYVTKETIYIVAVFDCRQDPRRLSDLFRKRKKE